MSKRPQVRTTLTLTAALVAVLAGATACVPAEDATVEPTPTATITDRSKPAPEETPEEAEETVDDTERTTAFDRALKDALGVQDAYTELAAADATLWGGYIAGVRIDGARAYVTLQVAADDPQRDDLGTRAAKAMGTLLPGTAVEDINWLIVEDANGTVIAQEQPNPIM